MNKTIRKVFMVIGLLIIILIVWAFVFGNGLSSIFNGVIAPINAVYQGVIGDADAMLIPEMESDNAGNLGDQQDNAFDGTP